MQTSAPVFLAFVIASKITEDGSAPSAPFTTSDPFLVRYYHTIVLDGVNDFAPEESFATASFQHTGYVAWDLDYLYLGMTAFDLSVDEPNTWFVGYLGGMLPPFPSPFPECGFDTDIDELDCQFSACP